MSSGPATEADAAEPLDSAAVAAYLSANPEFFVEHPDLLAQLRIPHPTRGAVSLIEHQVAVLRERLEREQRRLAHLIARARDYEDLSDRLHALTLRLIAARDLQRARTVLDEALRSAFNAEAVTLKLFSLDADALAQDPLATAFLEFVDRPHALCGPIELERNQALFAEQSEGIACAALIPIHAEPHFGVLAIGSRDPERFRADMGTELLDRLGQIVSQQLLVLFHHRHD
ncbi:hypothetical protein Thimo_3275 [Thioflavicoccus mobilis 8321]|uniref:DUF484 domain-containing protein n=1 Tax=Thioflavicoccus mobilis 8321 TaxID=765912 RepID=L0GYU9_9GAMM|nr:DUF484 family protein [Thioflavicoccus mobilis]AGA91953.1 hypothetical protein Thimo_3275 [Thioflavicoccus mobilis 8321]